MIGGAVVNNLYNHINQIKWNYHFELWFFH
jgi:hypothetical protein